MRLARTTLISVVAAMALGVGTASASTTLHFFGVGVRFQITSPAGKVLGPHDIPMAGDTLVAEARLYAGNHRRHGDRRVGVAHLSCTFTSNTGTATCTALLTINGRGQLTGTNVTVTFAEGPTIIPLNGGNGAFTGTTTGSVKVEALGDSPFNDFIVVYS